MRTSAAQKAEAARPALLRKAQFLGASESDIDAVLSHVRDAARITINFNPAKSVLTEANGSLAPLFGGDGQIRQVIDELIEEGQYKNQFETGISGGACSARPGGSRDEWERVLFQGAYHEKPMFLGERPKYGALNLIGNPQGGAPLYGNSYFVLKKEVSERATFTPFDSSRARPEDVGTVDHFEHVLWKAELDLPHVCAEAQGRTDFDASNSYSWGYVEAQIHGTVDFAKDVEAVVVDVGLKDSPTGEKVRAFAQKYGIELRWHDGVTVTAD